MPTYLENPHRARGLLPDLPRPRADAETVGRLLERCPKHVRTPLREAPSLAREAGVSAVAIKDESGRMGLGSFKALGAAFVIARDTEGASGGGEIATALLDRTYVAASAGNHGLSVAAGAGIFGARAIIVLADSVPEAFADRLRSRGAEVVREGTSYAASMAAAERIAEERGGVLLSDSSWEGYLDPPLCVMEGYLQMASEIVAQIETPPSHVLLQAGVGGLAAALARHFRTEWGYGPRIVVVEPDRAPALFESIRAGRPVTAEGPASEMGRLDCKTPSIVALAGLAEDADGFATITEEEARRGVERLRGHGFETTASGGAGVAALLAGLPGIGAEARVVAILSEGPEDG